MSEPHPSQVVNGLLQAGDVNTECDDMINFVTVPQKLQVTFNRLVSMIQQELDEVKATTWPTSGRPDHVLEIFCHPQSELTRQVTQLGYQGRRHGYQEGDLSTPPGRQSLFRNIIRYRPKHLWYSPTCGPWSSWSALNQSKSIEQFDAIQQQREQHLHQLALGIVLLRHQILHQGHLHWEQPQRSLMFRTPLLQELFINTCAAAFDMCKLGQQQDPETGLLYQKGMTIRTTSPGMFQRLHGHKCTRQHVHQPLEGQVWSQGKRINRTELSERYPRKLARYLAKILTSIHLHAERCYHVEEIMASSAPATSRVAKRARLSVPKASRPLPATLIDPTQLPLKRRRINSKGAEETNESASTLCQQVVDELIRTVPRVGKHVIDQPDIIRRLQEMFPEKQVKGVLACKGTERHMIPTPQINPEEAPFRRSIAVSRNTQAIKIESDWENWQYLSKRQINRNFHPCYLHITVYAANPSSPSINHGATAAQETEALPPDPAYGDRSTESPAPEVPVQGPPSEPRGSQEHHENQNQGNSHSDRISIDATSTQHGERFRALSNHDKHLLVRMHKNLGHPSPQMMSQVLRQKGYPVTWSQGILDMKCSVCQAQQRPSIARPATLKQELDFGDKVSIDGVTWTSQSGTTFHFYHYLDHGTNYHVAMIAPNRAEDAKGKFVLGWLNWAGPPNELLVDSATEFTSEQFEEFAQSMNIKCTVAPPQAHWQMGKSERHGMILQEMLSKYEIDHPIATYTDMQEALTQCTNAKNACSLRLGFAPEVLVFGKGLRVPGSVSSDEEEPSHHLTTSGSGHGVSFRQLLARRESARKAFHMADNNMAIRRAILRRERPHRGTYSPGEWVMYWREGNPQGTWRGPAKVIQQEGNQSIFCTHMGKLVRAAPEHVRPVSALESSWIPPTTVETDELGRIQNYINSNARPPSVQPTTRDELPVTDTISIPQEPPTGNPNTTTTNNPEETGNPPSNSSDQPDNEPDITQENPDEEIDGTNVPIPDDEDDDELVCDHILCVDAVEPELLRPNDDEHLAWRMEYEVSQEERELIEHDPTALAFLTTNNKKNRSEVKLCNLTSEEREEFEIAKSKEIANWLHTRTVSNIARDKLSPEQILRCRWIYTWKDITDPLEQKKQGKNRKAKARLVVLGYLDPSIEQLPRDSPTLNRTARMMILQLISSMGWRLGSFDIKSAFLQGRPQEGRAIGLEPVPELARALGTKASEACLLEKSAYGLIDAPYLWHKELDATLRSLHFQPSPFCPCTYILYEPGKSTPSGVLGVHVDDGLCGGDTFFEAQLKKLEQKFAFGSREHTSFTFTGIQLTQHPDKSITLSQEKYISKIDPIHIHPSRRPDPNQPVSEEEKQSLRALIGSLQYASTNTRPDLASRLSYLQSDINKATVETLMQANRVLHEAKRYKDTTITIQPIPIHDLRFLAFSDASFSSAKVPDSHTGTIIMATHANIANNQLCEVSPLTWGCKKIQRVVVSTLSAETMSLNSTLDQLSWIQLFWSWILQPNDDWRRPKEALKSLPGTFAAPTSRPVSEDDLAVTDCKSLYDLVTRHAPPNCLEFRTQLQARSIKDMLSEGTTLRWVHSGAQLADSLTKVMQNHFLRHTLRIGKYRLHDEQQGLKDRATTRNRVTWLSQNSEESKT